MSNIQAATNELHRAFELLNKNFFDGELPEPAITIQSSGKRLSMGWCTTKEVWRDQEGKIRKYELNISAEYLNIELMETMDTMMHEMVHLYNLVNGIQDCSRGGTYHNNRFKKESERRGFYYPDNKPHSTYGWSFSRLTDETKEKILHLGINHAAFQIARRTTPLPEISSNQDTESQGGNTVSPGTKKSNSYKWTCPNCDLIVRSSKEKVNIICGDCNEPLVGS
ncbi:SprT-like domain-containing protein [Paenibacillus sp. MMO-58]|uniref:SprT-like domain-containing protein n=1 Tax=Paenibacillus sp. MMO-58 TaxID=3081290 RepID=UPI00301A6441